MTTFDRTGFDSPIHLVSLGLAAEKNGHFFASGSAVIIANGLALTARHVVNDFWDFFEPDPSTSAATERTGSHSMLAFQITRDGSSGALWAVHKLWHGPWTDLAVLALTPFSDEAAQARLYTPILRLEPPPVGETVCAFGFHTPRIVTDNNRTTWHVNPFSSEGTVVEVFERQRDSHRLNFPCFRTNARYDGGMSGGPVFDSHGHLCGVICSNLPPSEPGDEHVSYVTSLWPALAIPIDAVMAGHPDVKRPTIYDLALRGYIGTVGLDAVTVARDEAGMVAEIQIRRCA